MRMESVRCRVPVKMVAFPYDEVLAALQFSESEMEAPERLSHGAEP